MRATYIVLLCLLAGCTITGRINRRQTNADIRHSTLRQREYIEQMQQEPQQQRGYIEYTAADSTKRYLLPTTTDDGQTMATLDIPEVVVTAPSRSVPERNGKVHLDFVVTLPKELMGNCRGVEVAPLLHRQGVSVPLQELTIRGALFSKVQERNYWQLQRYMDVFDPDETQREWAYDRFIRYPYPEGTRLDSVVSNKTTISYFYTQEVPTAQAEGNRLLITLQGSVVALDHSDYRFPLSDTLQYTISSMLAFVDTTTRYITQVVEKYAVVNDRNHLTFPVNQAVIIDTLGDNEQQFARIEALMDEILNQQEYHVDSITLTASASPEGTARKNDRLAQQRTHALRNRLTSKFRSSGVESLMSIRWVGEDWTELERLLREDDQVKNRAAILAMIAATSDRDALEQQIRRRFPQDYAYMLDALYPRLRAVNFQYDLRRVGMVKDTIHTTIPDTLYARGVALLHARKYSDALQILGGFADRNAAICLLSLGYDQRAYNTLIALPEHPTHRYLLAIACARLNRNTEALEHFHRAVELNENLKYRGLLDPEISNLLKQHDHETNPNP